MELDTSYKRWLEELKTKIQSAQLKAAVAVNSQLLQLYWDLGQEIVQKQSQAAWGEGVLDRLSVDLRLNFPEIAGFSKRNLYAIRQWYLFYASRFEFVPQPVAQLPWGHNRLIVSKIKDLEIALFYVHETLKQGWSRDQLEVQIKADYYQSSANAITNFADTLPKLQSQLAKETIRNPYNFDFLGLENDALEHDIEKGLVGHIMKFLIELGKGFSFVGKQYAIQVSDREYFVDLLFYHLHLRCFVVIELKAGRFKPEHAGKLNFYLSAVDSQMRHPNDQPSIGLVLCKTKDSIEAEYALRDIQKPIGISEYLLTQALPKELESELPTVEQLENQLNRLSKDNG
jgi:predicted nuclease of restriction endonuclease-like (RecB) superfamily